MASSSRNGLKFQNKEELIDQVIKRFATGSNEMLKDTQVLHIYNAVQPDNDIDLNQVKAAILQITCSDNCDRDDLIDVLHDLDRRNFLLRDLKWEFNFLDSQRSGYISEDNGYFLFCAVHGKEMRDVWDEFLSKRKRPGDKLSFRELSVILCDIAFE